MKRLRIIFGIIVILSVLMLIGCTDGDNEWHATEKMVGDWEIVAIETEDGELYWETDKWDEYPFYYNVITIGKDGSYSQMITWDEDNIYLIEGTWVSEEEDGNARILVTLEEGEYNPYSGQFEIAWTNSTNPVTIRYFDSDYIYVFEKMESSSEDEPQEESESEEVNNDATANSESYDDDSNDADPNSEWVDPEEDMQYWDVDSSAFDRVGYSERTHTLDVQFDNSGWYRYTNISPSLFNEFINSESLGGFYNDYIKGQYPCIELE